MTTDETFEVLLRQAAQLRREERVPEAIAAYERLLARWPASPDSWYNLALLQRQAGHFEAALSSYQQALDSGVTRPEEVHLNRGVIYSDHLRRDDAAEQELLAALALNPNYVAALLNLANLHEDRGKRDEAAALYERILAIEPAYHEALARLANLKSVAAPDDKLIGRVRRAIALPHATAADKASLGFALGKLLDGSGAYDQAFEAYVAANRASRESAGPRAPYDREAHERFVTRIIETFTADVFRAPLSNAASPAIFICGMFRSGSTLTEQVLASHPRVTAGGELDILPGIVRGPLAPFPSSMTHLIPAKREQLAAQYRETLAKLFPRADLVTDKRPDNFLYIGLIKSLFPNAKVVHTTRDALDTCLSVFFLHLDHGMGYALDLMDIGHYYHQYRRLMAHWQSLVGVDIFDFDYDAFARDPKPAVEKLLAFCGLDWDDNCLSFHRTASAIKTASVWQVREPLYQRSSGRWRHYGRQLAPLRAYLGDFLRANH